MSEIEKMQKYIQKANIDAKTLCRYSLTLAEFMELLEPAPKPRGNNLVLAFHYGMAKGYHAAKAEVKHV